MNITAEGTIKAIAEVLTDVEKSQTVKLILISEIVNRYGFQQLANDMLKESFHGMGDRECPECEEETLVEKTAAKWECLNCGKVYDEAWLDESDE